MSALARCYMLQGIKVSGYDRLSSTMTDRLKEEGAEIIFVDDPKYISTLPDLVVMTPAIPKDNKLKAYFEEQRVQIVKRSEALEWITEGIDTIAVAGTHGKTTTSSMISYLLQQTGIRHTALLGGVASNYRSNFHSEGFELMVVEADEYDRSFLRLHPRWVVVTAMDPDHLDIYGTYEEMINGYRQFISQIQSGGFLLYEESLLTLIGEELMTELTKRNITTKSYGIEKGDFQSHNLYVDRGVWQWDMKTPGEEIKNLNLQMAGRHNVQNASAAVAVALELGASGNRIRKALPGYKGVSRRFEIRYKDEERVLVDDYAHHPEELKAAIMAMRETYGSPVMGVFQPHLFTRTRDFAKEFAAALDLLDYPVIIDIYPAREKEIEGVSSQLIIDQMQNPHKKWCHDDTWVSWVVENNPDVLIILGAGDLDKHIPHLIRRLY